MQQHAHWCAQVEKRVRAEVRALRFDPMHDGTQVLSIIERIGADVVIGSCGTHEEQPSVASDVAAVVTAVHHSICGFGPLQPFFDDDTVEEIWINEPGRVFIARSGVSELTPIVMTAAQVRDLVERMLRWSGRRLDLSQPFVDATLPDGSRLHVVIPDVTRDHWPCVRSNRRRSTTPSMAWKWLLWRLHRQRSRQCCRRPSGPPFGRSRRPSPWNPPVDWTTSARNAAES